MTTLRQKVTFDAAHRLYGYKGNCNMLHGHTWSVDIEIESNRPLDSCGMFIDYRVIKQYFKDYYDHRTILNMDDPLVDVLKNMGMLVTIINGNPTAENLAKKILADFILIGNLDPEKYNDYCTVIVHESADNSAEEYL